MDASSTTTMSAKKGRSRSMRKRPLTIDLEGPVKGLRLGRDARPDFLGAARGARGGHDGFGEPGGGLSGRREEERARTAHAARHRVGEREREDLHDGRRLARPRTARDDRQGRDRRNLGREALPVRVAGLGWSEELRHERARRPRIDRLAGRRGPRPERERQAPFVLPVTPEIQPVLAVEDERREACSVARRGCSSGVRRATSRAPDTSRRWLRLVADLGARQTAESGAHVAVAGGAAGERRGEEHFFRRVGRERAEAQRQLGVERGQTRRLRGAASRSSLTRVLFERARREQRDSSSTVSSGGASKNTPVSGPRFSVMPRRKR